MNAPSTEQPITSGAENAAPSDGYSSFSDMLKEMEAAPSAESSRALAEDADADVVKDNEGAPIAGDSNQPAVEPPQPEALADSAPKSPEDPPGWFREYARAADERFERLVERLAPQRAAEPEPSQPAPEPTLDQVDEYESAARARLGEGAPQSHLDAYAQQLRRVAAWEAHAATNEEAKAQAQRERQQLSRLERMGREASETATRLARIEQQLQEQANRPALERQQKERHEELVKYFTARELTAPDGRKIADPFGTFAPALAGIRNSEQGAQRLAELVLARVGPEADSGAYLSELAALNQIVELAHSVRSSPEAAQAAPAETKPAVPSVTSIDTKTVARQPVDRYRPWAEIERELLR